MSVVPARKRPQGRMDWTSEQTTELLNLIARNDGWRFCLFGKGAFKSSPKYAATRQLCLAMFKKDQGWLNNMKEASLIVIEGGCWRATEAWMTSAKDTVQTRLERLRETLNDKAIKKKYGADPAKWKKWDDVPSDKRKSMKKTYPYYFVYRDLVDKNPLYASLPDWNIAAAPPGALSMTKKAKDKKRKRESSTESESDGDDAEHSDKESESSHSGDSDHASVMVIDEPDLVVEEDVKPKIGSRDQPVEIVDSSPEIKPGPFDVASEIDEPIGAPVLKHDLSSGSPETAHQTKRRKVSSPMDVGDLVTGLSRENEVETDRHDAFSDDEDQSSTGSIESSCNDDGRSLRSPFDSDHIPTASVPPATSASSTSPVTATQTSGAPHVPAQLPAESDVPPKQRSPIPDTAVDTEDANEQYTPVIGALNPASITDDDLIISKCPSIDVDTTLRQASTMAQTDYTRRVARFLTRVKLDNVVDHWLIQFWMICMCHLRLRHTIVGDLPLAGTVVSLTHPGGPPCWTILQRLVARIAEMYGAQVLTPDDADSRIESRQAASPTFRPVRTIKLSDRPHSLSYELDGMLAFVCGLDLRYRLFGHRLRPEDMMDDRVTASRTEAINYCWLDSLYWTNRGYAPKHAWNVERARNFAIAYRQRLRESPQPMITDSFVHLADDKWLRGASHAIEVFALMGFTVCEDIDALRKARGLGYQCFHICQNANRPERIGTQQDDGIIETSVFRLMVRGDRAYGGRAIRHPRPIEHAAMGSSSDAEVSCTPRGQLVPTAILLKLLQFVDEFIPRKKRPQRLVHLARLEKYALKKLGPALCNYAKRMNISEAQRHAACAQITSLRYYLSAYERQNEISQSPNLRGYRIHLAVDLLPDHQQRMPWIIGLQSLFRKLGATVADTEEDLFRDGYSDIKCSLSILSPVAQPTEKVRPKPVPARWYAMGLLTFFIFLDEQGCADFCRDKLSIAQRVKAQLSAARQSHYAAQHRSVLVGAEWLGCMKSVSATSRSFARWGEIRIRLFLEAYESTRSSAKGHRKLPLLAGYRIWHSAEYRADAELLDSLAVRTMALAKAAGAKIVSKAESLKKASKPAEHHVIIDTASGGCAEIDGVEHQSLLGFLVMFDDMHRGAEAA